MTIEDRHVCPVEIAGVLDNRFRRWLQNPRKIVGPYLEEGMTVLDFGCGPGFFTVDMAEMVGRNGLVIAADLQEEMLQIVWKKIEGTQLEERITLHQCAPNKIGWAGKVDFALAFYVLHEIPNLGDLFEELSSILIPGRQILLVEPPLHVSRSAFQKTLDIAQEAGFSLKKGPNMLLGMTAVLKKVD